MPMDLVESALSQSANDMDVYQAKIAVCGCGGGGSNTIQRLAKMGIKGATLVAVNTDANHLKMLDPSVRRILIGGGLTRGSGLVVSLKSGQRLPNIQNQNLRTQSVISISFSLQLEWEVEQAPDLHR